MSRADAKEVKCRQCMVFKDRAASGEEARGMDRCWMCDKMKIVGGTRRPASPANMEKLE
jgi:hypothetical protein